MDLNHEFRVSVPIERAWAALSDIEVVGPCLPGAELQGREGEDFLGRIRVKLGPVVSQYRGKARFLELDGEKHRMVLRAEGRDTRGQGNAKATIQADLEADGEGTLVRVHTDLGVTGRVAQMGRGLLGDVSARLMDQFVVNLEEGPLAGREAAAESAPVDVLKMASGGSWMRPATVGAAVLLLAAAIWYFSR